MICSHIEKKIVIFMFTSCNYVPDDRICICQREIISTCHWVCSYGFNIKSAVVLLIIPFSHDFVEVSKVFLLLLLMLIRLGTEDDDDRR